MSDSAAIALCIYFTMVFAGVAIASIFGMWSS